MTRVVALALGAGRAASGTPSLCIAAMRSPRSSTWRSSAPRRRRDGRDGGEAGLLSLS